jgi:putative peptide zinc metalloprotease protein
MDASLPKLRGDLIVRTRQTSGETTAVIKDPVSGRFFGLGDTEHFIVRQLDGHTSLDVIRQRAESQFDAALSLDTLSAFLHTVKDRGLLDSEGHDSRRGHQKRSRIRGGPLYCRFKVFDPSPVLNRLTRWTAAFYSPAFGVMSAFAILTAAVEIFAYWTDFRHELPGLISGWQAIVAVVTLNFLIVGVHEFGHGLTCTRYGGEVREMGCALIFFQPAFYCNVSDAWFLDKKQRLWIGVAGPYMELVVWSIAVWMWLVTEPDTWIHFAALSVMVTSGVKTLLNFNPLLKFDGYYLLSDYLDIPNLRRRSFRYVGRLLERVFGVESTDSDEELTTRERKIFFVYGILALAGSFSILAAIIVSAGGSLVDGNSPSVVLATTAFLGLRYRRRLRRMFRSSSASDEFDDDDVDTTTTSDPKTETTVTPPDKPNRSKSRRLRRWAKRAAWLAVAGGALVAIVYGRAELRVQGPFSVYPIENDDVRATVDGMIDTVLVREGDRVKKGDVIAQLYDKDLLAQLKTTESQIAQTDATLKKLMTGPTPQEVDVAQATVNKAQDTLRYARSRLTMMKQAFDDQLMSRRDFEDIEAQEATARNELAVAEEQLALLMSGSRPEDIEATNEQIRGLRIQRNNFDERLQFMKVLSPSTGIVATPTLQLKQLHHQLVKKGDLLLKVYDLETVTAQIEVPEKEIGDVHVGQRVVLRARAYPSHEFHGTVTFIATSAQGGGSNPGNETGVTTVTPSATRGETRTVLVMTQIDNESLLLKPAMTGQAKIFGGERPIIDLITRRLAHTVRVEFWSWW